MNETEGRELAAIRKTGEPRGAWSQDRPNTLVNEFGVLDSEGKAIKGLQVELAVILTPRLGLRKFVFTLKRVGQGITERAYQLEINERPTLKPGDHAYSHEHYGQERRIEASRDWAHASFEEAVALFCSRVNLTLTEPVPHYEGMELQ